MELDLEGQFADRAYPILASLVVPRPIALVTTISPDGKVNAAPFSFFIHLREELFDAEKKRVRSDKLFLIGRMASPHWYCKTRDRFEMIRPE
jgi:hypothetical protein